MCLQAFPEKGAKIGFILIGILSSVNDSGLLGFLFL